MLLVVSVYDVLLPRQFFLRFGVPIDTIIFVYHWAGFNILKESAVLIVFIGYKIIHTVNFSSLLISIKQKHFLM